MTDQELQAARRQKWHTDGNPIRTLEAARDFVQSVGLCVTYAQKPAVLVPTFLGAYLGSDSEVPEWQHAFRYPRSAEATELIVRLLRQRVAYEANVFGGNNLLLSAEVFPFFYALTGDRNPKQDARSTHGEKLSPLAQDAFATIQRDGPISKRRLAEVLGGAPSGAALDRALGELWSRLKITRVDYSAQEGGFWDVMYRWAPELVKEGINLSVAEGLSALISKYLDCVIAAELSEIEDFFSPMVARSRVREAVNALLAAREFSFVTVGRRTLIRLTPPVSPAVRPSPEKASSRKPA
jgi:23S rRNA pseudouridine2605 synthase